MISNATIDLSVSNELKSRVPTLALAAVAANVKVEKHNTGLWDEINQVTERLRACMKLEELVTLAPIAAMRNAYKTLGKDPSRYRGSAEALLRRILSGKGLYEVNNVVDINNLLSIETFRPVGSYDLNRVSTPIELRIGLSGETYKGIGKELINIENLPVFADRTGAFGSPTSDSERAMIRLESTRILMVIFSFAGAGNLEASADRARQLLENYAAGTGVSSALIT